jgi:hypothetical protein
MSEPIKHLVLSARILFELPTDGDPLYRFADLPHLPRIGDEVYFGGELNVFEDFKVESVRFAFNWGCIVVELSEIEIGEDRDYENKLIAEGWVLYDMLFC